MKFVSIIIGALRMVLKSFTKRLEQKAMAIYNMRLQIML